jgi:capsular polysaccharide biosynthesis protein/Mrp family chromosome partitioning ATPase
VAVTDEASRSLSEYLTIVRRRLWIIVLVAVITVGAAALYTFRQPTEYRSAMKIVVGQGGGILQPTLGNVADPLTQTMKNLLQSEEVAAGVIGRMGLDITPTALLNRLTVSTKPETEVLEVLYDDTNRERGREVLSTVGQVFTQLVSERLTAQAKDNPTQAVTATVFDSAHFIPGHVQPKPVRNLGVAAVLGILLGFVSAFVREQFDTTIRTVEDAEASFGQAASVTMPPAVLGYRPFGRLGTKQRDPVLTELAVQRLRAGILWSPESREARSMLVTSANPEEGKTTVTANLAVALARENHSDVIVVDTDLRRPTLHSYLGIRVGAETVGFDALVRGEAAIQDALIEIPLFYPAFHPQHGFEARVSVKRTRSGSLKDGRLRAILASPGHGWPAEFGFERVGDLIEELREEAEIVIFDSPPLLAVTDAYPFAAAVDTVIAVIRSGKTNAPASREIANFLHRLRAKRIELVVTELDSKLGQTYYYHSQERNSSGRGSKGDKGGGSKRPKVTDDAGSASAMDAARLPS